MRKILPLTLVITALIFLAPAAMAQAQHAPATADNTTTNVKAQDFAPGQLEAHYAKHGYKFGKISIEEYLQDARDLLDALPGKDLLQKIRPNGDILHYRPSTGEFAVMADFGRIRTYFKTDYRYWQRQ